MNAPNRPGPVVQLAVNPDGSITVRTNAKVTIEALGPSSTSGTERPPEVADRLTRHERYDPATLSPQTFDNMVKLGYKPAEIKAGATAPYIRMVFAAAGKSSTLYLDSVGLFSDNAQQFDFAKDLPGAETSTSNRVRFPFTLGQEAIDKIALAFKNRVTQAR